MPRCSKIAFATGAAALVVGLPGAAILSDAASGPRDSVSPRDSGGSRPAPQPNVIFISVDTLRADHLGCYGYERDTSPQIDALAARGVRFANAFSQASWTLPSHISMMTSQYPHVHGVHDNGTALPPDATTLAGVLSERGYDTAAFVSWVYLGKTYGFDRGFDEFNELLPPEDKIDSETSSAYKAEQVTDAAIRWLERPHEEPFFLFLHYFDPHMNYEAPEPYRSMFDPEYAGAADGSFGWLKEYIKGCHRTPNQIDSRSLEHVKALYDGEIRYTDTHLGRLFDALDGLLRLDNCLIIFTSDHGEEFNEHGSLEGHQWTLYDEVIHVPLIVRLPGDERAGETVEGPVQLIDIATTILRLLEIPVPGAFQGRDLRPWIAGAAPTGEPLAAFGEIDRFNRKQYVRTERYKLIHTDDIGENKRGVPVEPGYELYDLLRDPAEQRDALEQHAAVAGELMWRLERHRRSHADAAPVSPAPGIPLSDTELSRLRSLGYVAD
jgi:arylsulfatase A-like enzyme